MTTPTSDSYRHTTTTLTPLAVSQYLASHGWTLESRRDHVKEIWTLPDGGTTRQGRIMLPLATDYADFQQRFNDVLTALGHIYDSDPEQLRESIAAARADFLFVRLNQAMTDQTIPFRQAEKTIEALYKMLKAAATSAADPQHSHRGRRPTSVSTFLDEDIRLGHTKRGSFVFTVVTRLGDPLPPSDTGEHATVFQRRVMETLARGLEATRELAQSWDPRAFDAPNPPGLSASLVESLEDMTYVDDLRSIDLSFDWAVAEPRPDVGTSPIILDRDVMAGLPRVRERLVREEEPPRRETIVGTVRSLSRADSSNDDDEAASVVVVAEVGGKPRSVHVTLAGEDHDWAVVAYQHKLPFTVTGDLVFERRAWRLTGEVEVDASFLRHRTGDQQQH